MTVSHVFTGVLLMALAVATSARAQDDAAQEPTELTNARATYEKEAEVAMKPVKGRYIEKLVDIRQALTAKNNLKGALAVDEEIQRLKAVTRFSAGTQRITPDDALTLFQFPNNTWRVVDDTLTGTSGDVNLDKAVLLMEPIRARTLEFSFAIKAEWYQVAEIRVDDVRYRYGRGCWQNTAAGLWEGAAEHRLEGRVTDPQKWHTMKVVMSKGNLAFYYDGKSVAQSKLAIGKKGIPAVQIGFNSYERPYAVKDISLKISP